MRRKLLRPVVPCAVLLLAQTCGSVAPRGRPNILFVLIDSLRADRVGFAGYTSRPTTPTLDSLARHGVSFTSCVAQAPFTRASVPSMLTSRYPRAAIYSLPLQNGTTGDSYALSRLGREAVTLQEVLSDHGYTCAAFVANGLLNTCVPELRDGFPRYEDGIQGADGDCAGRLTDAALGWLLAQEAKEPWLCYIHYMDVHFPYIPPPEYRESFAPDCPVEFSADFGTLRRLAEADSASAREEKRWASAMYDAEVAYVDAQIGRLLRALRQDGKEARTLIVIASDHGVELYDHGGFGHGHTLQEELIRCPLIIVWPGRVPAACVVARTVQNLDIAPTVLSLAGYPIPQAFMGHALEPAWEEEGRGVAYSECCGDAVEDGRWKLWRTPNRRRLFELVTDPCERHDLAAVRPEIASRMESLLVSWEAATRLASRRGALEPAPLDSATAAMLRATGYLQ